MEKASRFTEKTNELIELQKFLQKNDVSTQIEIYLYMNNYYINANIIVEALDINISQISNYITIRKKVFVNKYDVPYLITSSKSKLRFELQDMILNMLYSLGKNQSIMDSANQEAELAKLKDEISVITFHYEETIKENKSILRSYSDLEKENFKLKYIIKELSKYVKTKTKIPSSLMLDTILEEEYQDEENQVEDDKSSKKQDNTDKEIERESLLSNAKIAIRSFNMLEKRKNRVLNVKYILRSVVKYYNNEQEVYQWQISAELPRISRDKSISFKDISNEIKLTGINTYDLDFIWFMDVNISEKKEKILSLIIENFKYLGESVILELINILIQ